MGQDPKGGIDRKPGQYVVVKNIFGKHVKETHANDGEQGTESNVKSVIILWSEREGKGEGKPKQGEPEKIGERHEL